MGREYKAGSLVSCELRADSCKTGALLCKIVCMRIRLDVTLGPVHTYPDIFGTFENSQRFFHFLRFQRIHVHTQRIRIVFARPHENAKTASLTEHASSWKHKMCGIIVCVCPHVNEKPAFSKISTLESVLKRCVSPDTC